MIHNTREGHETSSCSQHEYMKFALQGHEIGQNLPTSAILDLKVKVLSFLAART